MADRRNLVANSLVLLLLAMTAAAAHAVSTPPFSEARPLARAAPAVPTTGVCGNINAPTTWTLASSPYVVTCDTIYVYPGVTLTVEAGVVVKFQQGNGRISVDGALVAPDSRAPNHLHII